MRMNDSKQHFSIRKLTVGAASVLIGTATALFVDNNDSVAKADTEPAAPQQSESTGDSTDITEKTNLNIVSSSEVSEKAKSADPTDQTPATPSKGDGEVEIEKGIEPKSTPKVAKLTETGTPTSNDDPTKDKTDTKTPDLATSKNYGVDPVKYADNGGYDPAIWGKMNVGDWELTGNEITGYSGDTTHIIIPNSSDFGQTVEISSAAIYTLVHNTDPSKATQTIAISLNGNSSDNKVKAMDDDWSNTFSDIPTTNVDLSNLDTSNIKNMSNMFANDNNLQTVGDISNWNTENVTNMSNMFDGDVAFKDSLDLQNWNTSAVTNFEDMFHSFGAPTLNISGWNFTKADGNQEDSNATNINYGTWANPENSFLSPSPDNAKELIAYGINGTFTGLENKFVITVTDDNSIIDTPHNELSSSIYLVNKDGEYLTVIIGIPSVIPATSSVQDAQSAIFDYIEGQVKEYIKGKDLNSFNPNTDLLINPYSIFAGNKSRTSSTISDNPVDLGLDDNPSLSDISAAISNYLKKFFNIQSSQELKWDVPKADDPDYPNLPLVAAAHGEFRQKVDDNSGSGYYPGDQDTTPDTPSTTPDIPNTDNNGDQGKEPNNSNKGDNDKHDHGNKGTGSATSNNTNTGRNTGSVTKLDNSGAGSNKAVNSNAKVLPQTGEKETSMASVFGLAAIALGGLMGLAGDRKKKRN